MLKYVTMRRKGYGVLKFSSSQPSLDNLYVTVLLLSPRAAAAERSLLVNSFAKGLWRFRMRMRF